MEEENKKTIIDKLVGQEGLKFQVGFSPTDTAYLGIAIFAGIFLSGLLLLLVYRLSQPKKS